MKCIEIFNLYKRLQYLKKLITIDKLTTTMCNIKKLCPNITFSKFVGGFDAYMTIKAEVDINRLKLARKYGDDFEDYLDE